MPTYLQRRLPAFLLLGALAGAPSVLAQSSTTIVVSPIAGNPTANGNALYITLVNITDASSAKPYVIRLDPGTYDVADTRLQMKPWVSIVGSGQTNTVIQGYGNFGTEIYSGVIWGANNAELRDLTVLAYPGASRMELIPIFLPNTSPTLRNVTALSAGGTDNWGLRNVGGSPLIEDCTFKASGGTNAFGIVNYTGPSGPVARPVLRRSQVSATGAQRAIGIYNEAYALPSEIRDCQISASGTTTTYGLQIYNPSAFGPASTLKVTQSAIEASGGGTAMGARLEAPNYGLTLELSQVRAKNGGINYGLYLSGSGAVTATECEISGGTNSVFAASAPPVQVALSRLAGPAQPGGAVTCSGVVDASYNFLAGPACP